MFSWLKNRRRRELLAQSLSPEWQGWLLRNVAIYRRLPEPLPAKLHDLVKVFVAEKNWEGCGGLELTDEMRVTIAGQACLLVLGIEPNYYFDRVQSILLYPDAYVMPKQVHDGGWLVEEDAELLGECHYDGAIVLSWGGIASQGRHGHEGGNLVLHEFSHNLDSLDGGMDGTPPLANQQERRSWQRVTDAEYHRLVQMAERGRPTLLDTYGAENKAEFFAVATECFFEKPRELSRRHPDLYDALRGFYRLDPALWREPAS